MNKHLLTLFLLIPLSLFAMEESLYRRIAISAEKKDVKNDLTFEKALSAIDEESLQQHLKYKLKAFAATYLRREVLVTYNQMKAELDTYCYESQDVSVGNIVLVMKRVIDNWHTAKPEDIFKYIEEGRDNIVTKFLTDPLLLALKDPRKEKRQ